MRMNKRWSAMLALPITLGLAGVSNAATCTAQIASEWSTGYTVTVTILNDSESTIDDWVTSWSFTNVTVNQLWNGELSGTNPYQVRPLSYNQQIAPGASVEFGFNASKGAIDSPAELPVLGGICDNGPMNRAPIADGTASPTSGTVPFNVVFDATASTDPDGDSLSYLWTFSDGTRETTPVVTRQINLAGQYTGTLTVNDGSLTSEPQVFDITARDSGTPIPLAYTLDDTSSSLHFVSTKKAHVIESHTFSAMSGQITEQGVATLVIDLNSVDTANTTRDGRMRDLLFNTSVFATATVSLTLDMAEYESQMVGTTQTQSLEATLDLHGVQNTIVTDVFVSKLSEDQLLVQNAVPVLLNTTDYNLNEGVEALRSIANLSVISYAVPVNFSLVFNRSTNAAEE